MEMSMNRKYYEMHRAELIYVSKVLKLSSGSEHDDDYGKYLYVLKSLGEEQLT